MSSKDDEEKSLLPHHVQQPLCTTRLSYRQGRKLTAVKVYTINDESVHLLIFGVPSLNLRQETKSIFCKFGKLIQFNITTQHPAEAFTDTYHALYERLQSARNAKRMVDGKNFYGGVLHVCYAPEMESLDEVRSKLMQRKKDVYYRLKNNEISKKGEYENKDRNFEVSNVSHKDVEVNIKGIQEKSEIINEVKETIIEIEKPPKMNMAEVNIITFGNKRKKKVKEKVTKEKKPKVVDIVDCTSAEKETVTNIYEALNNKVDVRKIPTKPLNKIVFFNKK